MPAPEPVTAEPPTPPPDSGGLASLEAGLDALSLEERQRSGLATRLRRSVAPPVVAIVLFLAAWQLFVWSGVRPTYTVPGPVDVWAAFAEKWSGPDGRNVILESVGNSLRRGFVGFAIAVAVGAPLGLLIARARLVRTAIGPIVTGLQSLPSVAWVPAAIIWFGFSDAAIYFVVLLGAVPSIANGLVAGLDQVPPLYHRVGRVLGATRLAAVRFVLLPAALPGFLAGLKQGWAFSWRSLMAAELITFSPELGRSLGQLLQEGRELSDMSLVAAAILVILVVGIAVELLVFAPLERRVLRSRGLLAERS